MSQKATQIKSDFDFGEKLEDCLRANKEYQAACRLLHELREQAKKLEMSFAFEEYENQASNINSEAVEALLKGESVAEINTKKTLISDREFMERKINLLKTAINRQQQKVQKMEPRIWAASLPQYEAMFEDLFNHLLDAGEKFWECLHRLQLWQEKVRVETKIDPMIWPGKWKIQPEFYQRIGINLDGRGAFRHWLDILRQNWLGENNPRLPFKVKRKGK